MKDASPHRSVTRPRLLIIELDYHAEVLTTLCPILAERFELVLWTTDKIWKKTGLGRDLFAEALVMPKKQSVARFWQAHEEILRAVDVLYFNTLEKHFRFFAGLDFRCPTIMRIHNTNASLFPAQSINWAPANLGKVVSYFIRYVLFYRAWYHRERLYRKVSALMLPSDGVVMRMRDALLKRGIDNLSQYVMPFSCLGDAAPPVPGPAFVFAVTGSVDARRKDYDVLYRALERLKAVRPDWRLEMVFLGWAKGESAAKVLDRFAQLTGDTFNLTCFRDYVSQQIFAAQMARTQFLIAPMKLETHQKIHNEYYGTTKISGIENDALRYCKPVILPRNYTLPPDLSHIALTYEDPHSLCDAMITMIDGNHWRALTERFAALDDYKSTNIANNFYQLYLTLLNHSCDAAHPTLSPKECP
jgi:glycosyltransferase involved in cell wall biosynthesis